VSPDFDSGGQSDGDRTSYRCHHGDRPDEIEITPEMIEAGVAAFFQHHPTDNSLSEMAAVIFGAMYRVVKTRVDASESP
jgi:hypothetical protein